MVLVIVKQEYRDVNAAPSQRPDGGSCCNWKNIQVIQGRARKDNPGRAAPSLPNVFMAKASMTFRGLMKVGICMFVSVGMSTQILVIFRDHPLRLCRITGLILKNKHGSV